MKRLLLPVLAALMATSVVHPTPASAYCAQPAAGWPSSRLHIRAMTTPATWDAALAGAGSQWNDVAGAAWSLSYYRVGFVGPVSVPQARLFRQAAAPGGWGGAPALTALSIDSSKRITSGDVYFDSSWSWNLTGTMRQSSKVADVRTVAVHEFGHEILLNHPSGCGAMTEAEKAAAMNPAWVKRWATNADDKAGLAARK